MRSDNRNHRFLEWPSGSTPRIVVYAENAPTGEDLEACLDGRYRVEVATDLERAVHALDHPAAALLVVPADGPEPMGDWSVLLHRALVRGCRVLVLGPTDTIPEAGLADAVRSYPAMPDPAVLHHDLTALIT